MDVWFESFNKNRQSTFWSFCLCEPLNKLLEPTTTAWCKTCTSPPFFYQHTMNCFLRFFYFSYISFKSLLLVKKMRLCWTLFNNKTNEKKNPYQTDETIFLYKFRRLLRSSEPALSCSQSKKKMAAANEASISKLFTATMRTTKLNCSQLK